MLDLVGKTLGQYQIVAELGRGGMAVVYRAHQPSLNRDVAIKVLPPQLALDDEFIMRFKREAVAAAALRHPNIVVIHDVASQESIHYIVMELLSGVTLDHLLADGGPLPPARALGLMRQVAAALDYAHGQGLVHRDIKPSNIMIGAGDHATLMDFGVARAGEGGRLTRTGIILGTPDYMAPEQAQGLPVDYRTDLYALGVVLYEMLTGHVPFERPTPHAVLLAQIVEAPPPLRTLKSDLSSAIEAVMQRALAKDPAQRYPSAGELVAGLEQAVAQQAALPYQPPAYPQPPVYAQPAAYPQPASPPQPAATPAEAIASRKATPPSMAAVTVMTPPPGGARPPAPAPAQWQAPAAMPPAQVAPARRGRPWWLFGIAGFGMMLVAGLAVALAFNSFRSIPSAAPPAPTQPIIVAAVSPTSAPATVITPSGAIVLPTSTETAPPQPTAEPRPSIGAPTAPPARATPTSPPPTPTSPPAPTSPPPPTAPPPTATPSRTPTPGSTAASGVLLNFETFGTWRRGDQPNGTFTQSSERAHTGSFSGKLAYVYGGGDDFVVFLRSSPVALAGQPTSISAWVYGDNSAFFFNMWIQDAQGQVWQVPLGRVRHTGWSQMTGRIAVGQDWPWASISGTDNNQVDYPISFLGIVYDPPSAGAPSTIYVDDIQAGTSGVPVATPTQGTTGYGAPALIGPADGTIFRGGDAYIVLEWSSVGALKAGECYEVLIPHTEGSSNDCVTATAYAVPGWLFNYRPENRTMQWTVRVVREAGHVPLSPPSATWTFLWYAQ